jgi:hypothetical protein
MQHIKRRHKRCIEVQYSGTKEAQKKQWRNPCRGQSASALVAHQTVNNTCLVWTRLFGVTSGCLRREAAARGSWGCSTGLFGQLLDPTVDCYRTQRLADVARAPEMSGVHWTIWCARRQSSQLSIQRLESWGRLEIPHQPAILVCGSSTNIPRHILDISSGA